MSNKIKAENSESAAKTKKVRGKPFEKGKSGNPGGRKKVPEDIKQAFREQSPKALEVLTYIVNNPEAKDSDRIKAAECILDRAYGKPSQEVSLDMNSIPQVVFVGGDNVPD